MQLAALFDLATAGVLIVVVIGLGTKTVKHKFRKWKKRRKAAYMAKLKSHARQDFRNQR